MKARVLVADDEADLVELLRFELARRGYEVVSAHSGLAALNQARRCLPDLIILDLMMEGLDGFAVCELLRRQPSTADIPVLILTALSGDAVRERVLRAGAVDLITKPFRPQELVERLELALRPPRESGADEIEQAGTRVRQGPVYGWVNSTETD